MIKLEKLEKGEFFEDAFLVSYRGCRYHLLS